jgi:phospholipid/cholesterol/gamma-HCH transport system substrate-binding protein
MARGKLNQGQQTARQIRVGAVLIVGMLILAFGVFQVGRLFDVFASRYTLVTLVESSGGLIPGSPVTLAGQRVGQIQSIEFLPVEARTDSANIVVHFSVNENVQPQIRRDSRGALQTQGLLGDRFLNISPGSPGYTPLQPGDTLKSIGALDYEAVLRTAATTLDHVQDVVVDLRVLTDRLAAGEGTLGALLTDEALYQRMTVATAEMAALLRTVNQSDGTLSRAIRDPELYNRMTSTLARLDSLGAAVLDGEGSLGKLVRDDALYDGMVGVVGRADTTLAGVEGFLGSVAGGDGTMARLLEDPQLYDELLKTIVDLQALIQEIREDPGALSPQIEVF